MGIDTLRTVAELTDGMITSAWPDDLRGWGSDAPVFRETIEQVRPKLIIEVGTWKGASAIHMADICAELNLGTTIICVDTWLGAYEFIGAGGERDLMPCYGYPQVYYQFLVNVIREGHAERIIPFPQTSLIAGRWLWHHDIRADLIYLDGSHDYNDVRADIDTYWPLLRRGGVLLGDDFESFADIRAAVRERKQPFDLIDGRYWSMTRRD